MIHKYALSYVCWAHSFGPCWTHSFVGPCWAHSFVGPCWAHSFVGPCWPIHLLGPVGPINFQSFLMKNDILGYVLFRRSFFDSILELCRTHHKRLHVPREINQRRLQMKKYFLMKTWGRDQKLEVKGRFWS